ncbi:MAG: branched-chain amino acid transporter AzlD [Lentisphaerae bacterium]|nr:branched-chain amino acid transporter AzlD [Lentisphaerota bacterium]
MSEMTQYLILLLLVTGATNYFLRAFPFLLFGTAQKPPAAVTELGTLISPAAIAMLVVYCYCSCFKEISFADKFFGIAEWSAGIVVVLLHLWRGNPLLSIIAGTAVYMVMIQKIVPLLA